MNILIAGATSGIGRTLAISYLNDGHTVIAIGRSAKAIQELSALGMHAIELDITNLEHVRSQFALLKNNFESIDIAILNSGIYELIDATQFDAALFKKVIDTNLIGFANCVEAVLPFLFKSNIRQLVGIASLAGHLPLPHAQAYGASKIAVDYLLESLAIDLHQQNIKVTTVNPGFVKTRLTSGNKFPMPFIMECDEAVKIIRSGIQAQKAEIHFPYRLSLPMKLLRLLPRKWWRFIGTKL